MMNLRPLFVRSLLVAFAIPFLLPSAGCEQRYVGGPVAIAKGTPPEHGLLGVTFSDPPNALVLSEVLTEGPAFQSGIQTGDEILSLGNKVVETVEDVLSIVRSTHPGDEIVVRVLRSGNEIEFDVTLCDFGEVIAIRSLEDVVVHENAEP